MLKYIAIHPGDILKTEFLDPMQITPYRLAKELHVTVPRVNDIVLGKRGITADMALRLGRFFGTTPSLCSGLQEEYDRRIAMNSLSPAELDSIQPYAARPGDFASENRSRRNGQAAWYTHRRREP